MRARHIERKRKAELLGPDGKPIEKGTVPFIQWLPDGSNIGRSIERSPHIAKLAAKFMAKGGRYAFVLRADGQGEFRV